METSPPVVVKNVGFSTEGEVTKLFVGQVPKNFTEQQVKELMEPYGAISELNIIKDKETMCSRGLFFKTKAKETSKQPSIPPFAVSRVFIGPRVANENNLHVICFFDFLGCAFVTYCAQQSVIEAQRNLHEKKTLPGVSIKNVSIVHYRTQVTMISLVV